MESDKQLLEIEANIGFNCHSKNLLVIHPSEMFMLYAVGSLVVVKSVGDQKDRFLRGHSARVHYLTVSRAGNLVASGEELE